MTKARIFAHALVTKQLDVIEEEAAAIFGRFRALFDGELSPEAVLATPEAALRGAGLSPNKMASIRDLATKVMDGTLHGPGMVLRQAAQ